MRLSDNKNLHNDPNIMIGNTVSTCDLKGRHKEIVKMKISSAEDTIRTSN